MSRHSDVYLQSGHERKIIVHHIGRELKDIYTLGENIYYIFFIFHYYDNKNAEH